MCFAGLAQIILFSKCWVLLQVENWLRKHCHGMSFFRQSLNKLLNSSIEISSIPPLLSDIFEFMLIWKLSCHKQPEQSLGQGFITSFSLWKIFLNFWNRIISKGNPRLWVKQAAIIEYAFYSSHSSKGLSHSIVSNYLGSMLLLNFIELSLFDWDNILQSLSEKPAKLLWSDPS